MENLFNEPLAFKVDEAVVAKAKEQLKKLTAAWAGGICWGSAVDLDNKTIGGLYAHTVCHSWVTTAFNHHCGGSTPKNYNKGCTNFLILDCHTKKRSVASDKATDAIILWIAKESKFSKYILNRDDDESLTTDGAVILCGPDGATMAEALWICKVLRFSTEGARSLDTWLALKEGGVNPMLALRICSDLSDVKGATFGAATVTSHLSVFGNQYDWRQEPDLKMLAECKPDREATCTGALFANSSSQEAGFYTTTIKGFCKPVKKDDGWGGQLEGSNVTKDQLIYHALAWQEEVLGERAEKIAAPPKGRPPSRKTVFLKINI